MWNLEIKNVGGIHSAEATVNRGLNVVKASNFMGKSSFMNAIQMIMGTTGMYNESHPLTEGAKEGSVRLETDSDTYEVRLERSDANTITRHGVPFLEDEADQISARLFSFLGEGNPVRARVRNGEDLTDLLQAPIDIEDIDTKISEYKRKRESKRTQLKSAERAEQNIPAVTEAIKTLKSEIEDLRERRAELVTLENDSDSDVTSVEDELAKRRSRLATTEKKISRLEDQIERTEHQIDEKQSDLAALDIPPEPEVSADIEEKKTRIEECELQIDLLESLHRANQRVIDENEIDLVTSIDRTIVTDEVDCWVCGGQTTTDDIEERLAVLQETIQSLDDQKSTLTDEVEQIKQRQRKYRKKQEEQTRIETEIGQLTANIDELSADLSQAEDRKAELKERVTELEAEVEAAEDQLNEELTEVKAEIRTKTREMEDQQSRLENLQTESEQADTLREEIECLSEEITELRNQKIEKQWEIKDQFEAAMAAAIDRFAPGFDGARLDVKTSPENEIEAFDLVIARDGHETEIDMLSEGEIELIGVVVAIAGYRAFDVADRVPVIFLDGISQLSVDNLRRLVDYLDGACQVFVTTAYPEAGEFDANTISPAEWETVSDERTRTV